MRFTPIVAALAAVFAVGITGCLDLFEKDKGIQRDETDEELRRVAERLEARADSLAVKDTVGSVAWIQGQFPLKVRGYGIVVGLGSNGSKECPPDIRKRLTQEMRKYHNLGTTSRGLKELQPEALLTDLDTAVVIVEAGIPGAAVKGTRFDAVVTALPGTQTKSLEGGFLWRCELQRYRDVGTGGASLQGETLAFAEGPVFVNPFPADGENPTPVDLKRGVTLGGAVATKERSVRLEIRNPSFQTAMQVARQINERFTDEHQTAEAISPATIRLHIPKSYGERRDRFLDLVTHVMLRSDASFREERTAELAKELLDPGAPHDDIGLAWEVLGRNVLPEVRKLYGDTRPYVSFFAARTGIRLHDDSAVPVLRRHALNVTSEYQREAIIELGDAQNLPEAADALRPLLSHTDKRVRIWACGALRRRGDRYVESVRVGEPNFSLDLVRSDARPLIYARVAGAQTLALFGPDIWLRPPLHYESSDGVLNLYAADGDREVKIIARSPGGRIIGAPQVCPLDLQTLLSRLGSERRALPDGTVTGYGLPYSCIVRALKELCAARAIPGEFQLESPEVTDIEGPLEEPGRPETELE